MVRVQTAARLGFGVSGHGVYNVNAAWVHVLAVKGKGEDEEGDKVTEEGDGAGCEGGALQKRGKEKKLK